MSRGCAKPRSEAMVRLGTHAMAGLVVCETASILNHQIVSWLCATSSWVDCSKQRSFRALQMVGSPSGKVADCNSALASSTLAPTSKMM